MLESNPRPDIIKAAAVIVRDRKLLLVRSDGKEVFVPPGGKLEPDESAEQALSRELLEELGIHEVRILGRLGVYHAAAAGDAAGRVVEMQVFVVADPGIGFMKLQGEIAEAFWANSQNMGGREIGSIARHEIIPRLVEAGDID